MATSPYNISQTNVLIPSGQRVASSPGDTEYTDFSYGNSTGYAGLDYNSIQTTTVPPGTLTYSFTNEIYKSYMRKLDIQFIVYNMRPNSYVYNFFDGEPVDNLIQRLNVIELSSNATYFGLITPTLRNLPNFPGVSNGSITAGDVNLTREKITVGSASADIIFTELNANGNTVLYISEFRGQDVNSVISVGNTVIGQQSNNSSVIRSIKHYTGVLKFVPVTEGIPGANANGYISFSNTAATVNTVIATDSSTTYGLKLSNEAANVDNYYVGNTITFFSSNLPGITSNITSYNAASRLITVSPKVDNIRNSTDVVYSIGDGRPSSLYSVTGNTQAHFTSSRGFMGGILKLPGYGVQDRYNFKVGKRLFRVLDDANNNTEASTTVAEYFFSSYNIEDGQTVISSGNNVVITSSQTRSSVYPYKGKSPLAQSFFIDDADYPKGMFVPYIDVFFAGKGTQPIEMQIRPMVNGYPDSTKILRNATTILQPEFVNVLPLSSNTKPNTSNSSHYTRFTFPSPVYLSSGTEYAFVILTNDFDYKIYVSEVGAKILGTSRIISEQPYLGSLFKSQNSTTYDAIQSEDIMFVIHKCQFDAQGTVTFHEFKDPNDEGLFKIGDANLKMDCFTVMSDSIQLPGTRIDYRYQATTFANNVLDNDFTQFSPDYRVLLNDKKYVLSKDLPQQSFIMKVDLYTDDPDVSPIIFPERQELSTAAAYINNCGLEDGITHLLSTGNNYTYQNTSVTVTGPSGISANGIVVLGYADNVSKMQVNGIYWDNPGSGYFDNVSVTIVSSDANTTNDNAASFYITSESDPSGGPSVARYISKTVVLAPEFDAGDLRVYLTASKPPEANIHVYYKVKNTYDTEDIMNKNWVRMERVPGVITDSVNLEPLEFEYRPSLSSNNILYSTDVATYDKFNEFKIKIVLSSSSTSYYKIPYVYDMRAIALPGDTE